MSKKALKIYGRSARNTMDDIPEVNIFLRIIT